VDFVVEVRFILSLVRADRTLLGNYFAIDIIAAELPLAAPPGISTKSERDFLKRSSY
jgi:hypothetical protein